MSEPDTTGQTDDQEAGTPDNMDERNPSAAGQQKTVSRKEKRKALKKDKRKQIRKELAAKAREEEEARLNDPEEIRRIEIEEEREKERLEKERKEFEERERFFLEELQRRKEEEEEEERKNAAERESKLKQEGTEEGSNDDDDDEWEYIEEGPPEIIWQGNEIIVKKNKVKVKKKNTNQSIEKEDPDRPTSNPLPPQTEAYAAFKNTPMASTEPVHTVAQQVPNFGTEQDKAHCPFHIKTGACRFGMRCNRVHYYPDKSTTLLIKNMYNGPGLSWEQDEGLEYTEEEVDCSFEEFYEDVHTEFLKFGEIINFKVCRNGSFHLRGNVYVQYKSLDSAVMAYNSVHGRYFATKQVKCEFVSLTRWKVAICGEYMKSRNKTCSRGSACNFLHCFTNPGGDYEWADCDKPPPRFWVKKMTSLFGYTEDDTWQIDQPTPKDHHHISTSDRDRDSYHEKRHRSIDHYEENHDRKSRLRERKKDDENYEHEKKYKNKPDIDSDDKNTPRRHRESHSKRHDKSESKSRSKRRRSHGSSSDDEHFNTKRRHSKTKSRSRHKTNVLESSNGEESDDVELKRYKEQKRLRRRDHDGGEVERRWEGRSRSRDGGCFSEKNEMSDRWDPNELDHLEGDDGSRHVEKRKSRDRDDQVKEKRKRI